MLLKYLMGDVVLFPHAPILLYMSGVLVRLHLPQCTAVSHLGEGITVTPSGLRIYENYISEPNFPSKHRFGPVLSESTRVNISSSESKVTTNHSPSFRRPRIAFCLGFVHQSGLLQTQRLPVLHLELLIPLSSFRYAHSPPPLIGNWSLNGVPFTHFQGLSSCSLVRPIQVSERPL